MRQHRDRHILFIYPAELLCISFILCYYITMMNPIRPFPKFIPIGGLPWEVAALLLPEGRMLFMIPHSPIPAPQDLATDPVTQTDNVFAFPAKHNSGNDEDTGPELA